MNNNVFAQSARIGLILGAVAVSLGMIGVLEAFNELDVISSLLSLGQVLLYACPLIAGYIAVNREEVAAQMRPVHGIIAGVCAGIPTFALLYLTTIWETIRDSFINVSPKLIEALSFGNESVMAGGMRLLMIFAILGLVGAAFTYIPDLIRKAVLRGLYWAIGIGVMSEVLINVLRPRWERETLDMLFDTGVNRNPFIFIVIGIALITLLWQMFGKERYATYQSGLNSSQQKRNNLIRTILIFAVLMILPSILGRYLSQVSNTVALYILMGLGLNIAVGLAGLLDLGYVTNFAIGTYLMAIMTSGSEYGLANPIPFLPALIICTLAGMIAGFVFALPVLKMRGDYLAIATLGFGEIIRILAKSDAMKGTLGGAQGILDIPAISITGGLGRFFSGIVDGINGFLGRWDLSIITSNNGEIIFDKPPQLYYALLIACVLMLVVSSRLNNSRVGRRWMAIREDEDVAAAMGINTTNAKVVAFTLSAASGGLAGALFSTMVGSVFPSSFNLLISVNVLSLIIVGGLGSLPGIVVGAFALIGIPELLREFAEFRLLLYGIALMVMMLVRPEGLWPSEARKRELAKDDGPVTAAAGD